MTTRSTNEDHASGERNVSKWLRTFGDLFSVVSMQIVIGNSSTINGYNDNDSVCNSKIDKKTTRIAKRTQELQDTSIVHHDSRLTK